MPKMTVSATSVILLFVSLHMVGCSSPPPMKKDVRCAGIDWWEVGRTDGVAGTGLERGVQEHAKRCEGTAHPFTPDLYQNGRDAGLIDYCAAGQGFLAGQAGLPYEKVCPAYLEAAFLQQYRIGQRMRELEAEDYELASRIDDLERLLTQSKSGTALRQKISELRARQTKLDAEISAEMSKLISKTETPGLKSL